MAKKSYTVLSPISVESGTTLMPGETVEIEEKHAKELIALGAVEPTAKTELRAERQELETTRERGGGDRLLAAGIRPRHSEPLNARR